VRLIWCYLIFANPNGLDRTAKFLGLLQPQSAVSAKVVLAGDEWVMLYRAPSCLPDPNQ
jgi:hypothetical protein